MPETQARSTKKHLPFCFPLPLPAAYMSARLAQSSSEMKERTSSLGSGITSGSCSGGQLFVRLAEERDVCLTSGCSFSSSSSSVYVTKISFQPFLESNFEQLTSCLALRALSF